MITLVPDSQGFDFGFMEVVQYLRKLPLILPELMHADCEFQSSRVTCPGPNAVRFDNARFWILRARETFRRVLS